MPMPGLRRLAIMANVEYPNAASEMREVQIAARTLGVDAATFEIRRSGADAPLSTLSLGWGAHENMGAPRNLSAGLLRPRGE